MLDREAKVTVESIRAQLQRGSPNTVVRHLRAWKVKQEQDKAGNTGLLLKKQKTQNLSLRTEVEQQRRQLQNLSEQLLTRERTIVQLEKELAEVKTQKESLTQEFQQLQIEATTVKTKYETAVEERKKIVDELITNHNEQVTQFSKDLQAINMESLNSVRSIGIAGQEQLFEEKMKIRELQLGIKNSQTKIQELKRDLEQARNLHIPLQKKLKQQEQLIAHCLDLNKVEQFNQQTEVDNV